MKRPVETFVFLASIILIPGCGDKRSDRNAVRPGIDSLDRTVPEIPATDYLQQVLSRYRSTRSYRDLGEVRLRVEKDGRLMRQTAPMHVMLDGSTIWVAAYDARLWSDDGETVGWIADPQTNLHDSQVVIGGSSSEQRSTGRPILANLLRDPILTSSMVSGLGGPPPQLEWLLDPDPMAKLFGGHDPRAGESEPAREIVYDGIELHDQIPCVLVKVVAGRDVYRFWIDRQKSLIYRVELPASLAGQKVQLDGWKVHSLELVLVNASFQPPSRPYQLTEMPEADLPARPKYLRSLVPLPPPPPDRRLGRRAGAFETIDVTGRIKLTERGIGRMLTLWYAAFGQATPDANARNLQSINQLSTRLGQANPPNRSVIGSVCLADGASGKFLDDAGITNSDWVLLIDGKETVRKQFALDPGQATLVDWRGQMVWIGDSSVAADSGDLSAVVADSLAGVNVSDRMRRQWETDRDAYPKKLTELAAK